MEKKPKNGKKVLITVALILGGIALLLAAMGATVLIQQSLRPAKPTAAPTAVPTATPEPTPIPDRSYDAQKPLSFMPDLSKLGKDGEEIAVYSEDGPTADEWIDLSPEGCSGRVIRHIGLGYSYAVYDGEYYRLGEGRDGKGLLDVVLCDLNEDGEEDLLYTYHFGTGADAESKVGWFDPQTGEGDLSDFGMLGAFLALSEEDGVYYLYRCTRAVDENGSFALHFTDRVGEIVEQGGKLYLMLD